MKDWTRFSFSKVFEWAILGLLAALLIHQFFDFDVLQDDAFISFRYVRNFAAGHGLVFNIGERVEGYTNFLWIILLSFLTKLGLPLIGTARVTGILAAVATLGASAYAARRLYPRRNGLWEFSVPLFLAVNGALAYWAGSGLETGLFTFLAAASAFAYPINAPLSLVLTALATLTRPEGALLAAFFGICGLALKQKGLKTTLWYWAGLFFLLLPFAVFKYLYYDGLLPNPFYAKTGFSREYWESGLEYIWLFLRHYGGYGLLFLLPVFLWRKLAPFSRFCLPVFAACLLYILSVGGDVLPAHRFFLPALTFLYFPAADALYQASRSIRYGSAVFAAAAGLLALYFYFPPHSYLKSTGDLQMASVVKMSRAARSFDEKVRTVAASAIGALSYQLGDRRIIDMLGLVDTAVARHPEKIEGLVSTWKERNFNGRYVLSQKPDVILFSTGLKPSGLAERALFLYPDFRRNYRLEFAYKDGGFLMYYRRFQNLPADGNPDFPAQVSNLYNEAVNLITVQHQSEKSITVLNRLLETGPKDCPTFYTTLGFAYLAAGSHPPDSAEFYLNKGMQLDGGGSISRLYMGYFRIQQKQYALAAEQFSTLAKTVPTAAEFLRESNLYPSTNNR